MNQTLCRVCKYHKHNKGERLCPTCESAFRRLKDHTPETVLYWASERARKFVKVIMTEKASK